MTLTQFPELQQLSSRRKRQLADALWAASFSDATPATAAQKRLLDQRAKSLADGSARPISWAEVKERAARDA